jgi:hypothetical protein
VSTANPDVSVESASEIDPTAETVRRGHLHHEASMQALGVLFSLIGVVVLLATLFALSTRSNAGLEIRPGIWGVVDLVAYTVGIVATLTVGYGLRRLRRWARIAAIVLCGIFSLRLPDGTLIFPYFLYLLFSAKGRRVFAPDYGAILAATPQIRYPRSTVVWTVLAVLIVIVASIAVRIAIRGNPH